MHIEKGPQEKKLLPGGLLEARDREIPALADKQIVHYEA
jgi:hypothetical protein